MNFLTFIWKNIKGKEYLSFILSHTKSVICNILQVENEFTFLNTFNERREDDISQLPVFLESGSYDKRYNYFIALYLILIKKADLTVWKNIKKFNLSPEELKHLFLEVTTTGGWRWFWLMLEYWHIFENILESEEYLEVLISSWNWFSIASKLNLAKYNKVTFEHILDFIIKKNYETSIFDSVIGEVWKLDTEDQDLIIEKLMNSNNHTHAEWVVSYIREFNPQFHDKILQYILQQIPQFNERTINQLAYDIDIDMAIQTNNQSRQKNLLISELITRILERYTQNTDRAHIALFSNLFEQEKLNHQEIIDNLLIKEWFSKSDLSAFTRLLICIGMNNHQVTISDDLLTPIILKYPRDILDIVPHIPSDHNKILDTLLLSTEEDLWVINLIKLRIDEFRISAERKNDILQEESNDIPLF